MPRKFPLSLSPEDPESNTTKRDTLEYFAYNQGWHSPRDLEEGGDPRLSSIRSPEESKAIQMRLLRYSRQGLLSRRRRNRGYEYAISMKGEDRLFYLCDKLGETSTKKGGLPPEEKEKMTNRLNLKLSILEARKRALSDPGNQ